MALTEKLFDSDFNKCLMVYKKIFYKRSHTRNEKELLIEMLFQLGPLGLLKFKKMLYYLSKKQKYMVGLEMIDSLWYKQTPKRVNNLIKNFIK